MPGKDQSAPILREQGDEHQPDLKGTLELKRLRIQQLRQQIQAKKQTANNREKEGKHLQTLTFIEKLAQRQSELASGIQVDFKRNGNCRAVPDLQGKTKKAGQEISKHFAESESLVTQVGVAPIQEALAELSESPLEQIADSVC